MTNSMPPVVHVIDDEKSMRAAVSRLLLASGYRVVMHESAEQFLERRDFVERVEAGCILLDVNMPGISGLQLQERLAQAGCTLPIIFLTGNGDAELSARAIKAGAADFLAKPVAKADLLDAVQRALRK